jgi:hypothetical protein
MQFNDELHPSSGALSDRLARECSERQASRMLPFRAAHASLLRRAVVAVTLGLAAVASTDVARGDAPPPPAPSPSGELAPLLSRVARHADQFEQMKRRGSYTLSGKMEELDRSGKVDGTKEMVMRVTATPAERLTEIMKYIEDGADKTAEAKQKAEKRRAEAKKESGRSKKMSDLHLPFLGSEQPRYTFSLGERDAQKNQTRIVFQPKAAAEDAYKGSAWIDESTGEVLTIAFSPSKYPTFVDRVDVSIRFDLPTPLGRAPSSFSFDARGGFLVVHKHYRGSATITDARVAF